MFGKIRDRLKNVFSKSEEVVDDSEEFEENNVDVVEEESKDTVSEKKEENKLESKKVEKKKKEDKKESDIEDEEDKVDLKEKKNSSKDEVDEIEEKKEDIIESEKKDDSKEDKSKLEDDIEDKKDEEKVDDIKKDEILKEENSIGTEEKDEEKSDDEIEEKQEKKGFFSRFFKKKDKDEEKEIEEVQEDMLEGVTDDEKDAIKEKKDLDKNSVEDNKKHLDEEIEKENKLEKETFSDIESIEEKKEEIKSREVKVEEITEPKKELDIEDSKKDIVEEEPVKKEGFFSKTFSKLKSKKIDEDDFMKIWVELEMFLLEINIAYDIVDKIESKLREALIGNSFDRFNISKKIREVLESEVQLVLKDREADFLGRVKEIKDSGEVVKIMMLGVNGTGKTTTIAKIVHYLRKNNLSCVVAAGDTFRAAAVEQLEEHSKKLDFKLIKHKGGSDPSAVAFDAIEHAKAKGVDVVLIDTAGRMPNNSNLMLELQKIKRVSKSQMAVFIGDSISGNDLIEQIELFDKGIGIDGAILTKVDTDEKPGSVVTTAYSIEKPIYFLGSGQTYDDLIVFDSKYIATKLFEVE